MKKFKLDMFKIPSKLWNSVVSNTIDGILIAFPLLAMTYLSSITLPLLVDDPSGGLGFLVFAGHLIVGFAIAAYLVMVKVNYDNA